MACPRPASGADSSPSHRLSSRLYWDLLPSREYVDGQDHIPGKSYDQENALEEPTKLHCLRRVREGCLRCEISYRWNNDEQTGEH